MAWLRIALTEDEQRIVQCERESHTDVCVRRRLWVLWLLYCGLEREQAARIVGVAVSSVQRDVSLYGRAVWRLCGRRGGSPSRPASWPSIKT